MIQAALNNSSDEALLASYRRKLVLVLALGVVFAGAAGYSSRRKLCSH
jgi:hypothetical protein